MNFYNKVVTNENYREPVNYGYNPPENNQNQKSSYFESFAPNPEQEQESSIENDEPIEDHYVSHYQNIQNEPPRIYNIESNERIEMNMTITEDSSSESSEQLQHTSQNYDQLENQRKMEELIN